MMDGIAQDARLCSAAHFVSSCNAFGSILLLQMQLQGYTAQQQLESSSYTVVLLCHQLLQCPAAWLCPCVYWQCQGVPHLQLQS